MSEDMRTLSLTQIRQLLPLQRITSEQVHAARLFAAETVPAHQLAEALDALGLGRDEAVNELSPVEAQPYVAMEFDELT